ncbi:Rv1733c family protein [Actinacidiphila acididurans]|uniref:Uncharacterized protein n=1 Tax=Actinacidiphila acididurans TaxID=2784346 RepID=A0ABS2TVR3_9ACTN|nr:hypothetical protein [Actinacidiphila acididurans]MBM9507430.1 hypothetical protein [Actinacidiphila acididurans]
MGRREGTGKLGWRWRRNPLRRRSDLVEAWLGLVTVVVLCLLPLFGWWAGQAVDRALQRVVRSQRSERTLVTAHLVPPPGGHGSSSGADSDPRHRERLRWTAPDHSVHTAAVPVDLEVWQSDRIMLWTDDKGALVPPPLDAATATTHSVLAGTAAATSAAGLVLISRRVVLWRLMRRRMASWEREWARVGQDWGRAGAGG